jgi:hypothetical protein
VSRYDVRHTVRISSNLIVRCSATQSNTEITLGVKRPLVVTHLAATEHLETVAKAGVAAAPAAGAHGLIRGHLAASVAAKNEY